MKKIIAVAAFAMLIAGCSSTPTTDGGAPVQEGTAPSGPSAGAVDGRSVAGDPLNDPNHPLYKSLQARSVLLASSAGGFESSRVRPVGGEPDRHGMLPGQHRGGEEPQREGRAPESGGSRSDAGRGGRGPGAGGRRAHGRRCRSV